MNSNAPGALNPEFRAMVNRRSNMIDFPIIEVQDRSDNNDERTLWLRGIYDAADACVQNCEEPMHEVCYWPGSITRINYTSAKITVYWSDAISLGCFGWAFTAAWSDLGDGTAVGHVAMDDDDFVPFEASN